MLQLYLRRYLDFTIISIDYNSIIYIRQICFHLVFAALPLSYSLLRSTVDLEKKYMYVAF